ncbi:MAG: GNAT family N-acetyltransferase [Vicinamibacteria bacterium]
MKRGAGSWGRQPVEARVHYSSTETAKGGLAQSPTVNARVHSLADVDAAFVAGWSDLERRALEPNAFLSPHFVLPAVRRLEPGLQPVILAARDAEERLVAIGVFRDRGASLRVPLRHLGAFRSRHSYLSGWLLDRDHAAAAMDAFVALLTRGGLPWHGMVFPYAPADEGHRLMLEASARAGGRWFEYARRTRATLDVSAAGEPAIEALSSSRRKTLRRKRRQLEDAGPVEWRLRSGSDLGRCVDRFLSLEDAGWKGQEGGSLLSTAAGEVFFREMIAGLAGEGRAFFTELSVGGTVVSSTCNLESGHEGFAFKIGWDPEYAAMSVGTLNEIELMRSAPACLRHLVRLDSGSEPGSYMDDLWRGRRILVDGFLATTAAGRVAARAAAVVRGVKRRLSALSARSAG